MGAARQGAEHEPLRLLDRQVVEAVDGGVDAAVAEGGLQLRREDPLPAHERQWGLEDAVAARGDHAHRDAYPRPVLLEQSPDVVGLAQREVGAARPKADDHDAPPSSAKSSREASTWPEDARRRAVGACRSFLAMRRPRSPTTRWPCVSSPRS